MRILHLATQLDPSDITDRLLNLLPEQKRAGHQVYVWGARGDQFSAIRAACEEVFDTVPRSRSGFSIQLWFALPGLLSVLKEHSIDLMHAHTRSTQVLAQAASWIRNIPFVSSIYGYEGPTLMRRLFPCWGETVLAASPQVRGSLIETFHTNHLPPIEVVTHEPSYALFESVQKVYEKVLAKRTKQ